MHKKEVISHFGSQKLAAEALNLSRSYVCQWGNVIPEVQALRVEKITEGALKYDASLYCKSA